jgi:hypothetical protein
MDSESRPRSSPRPGTGPSPIAAPRSPDPSDSLVSQALSGLRRCLVAGPPRALAAASHCHIRLRWGIVEFPRTGLDRLTETLCAVAGRAKVELRVAYRGEPLTYPSRKSNTIWLNSSGCSNIAK